MTTPPLHDYIGDGVYVHFDGFGINMTTQREEGEHYIYVEPEVLRSLIRFATQMGIKTD